MVKSKDKHAVKSKVYSIGRFIFMIIFIEDNLLSLPRPEKDKLFAVKILRILLKIAIFNLCLAKHFRTIEMQLKM